MVPQDFALQKWKRGKRDRGGFSGSPTRKRAPAPFHSNASGNWLPTPGELLLTVIIFAVLWALLTGGRRRKKRSLEIKQSVTGLREDSEHNVITKNARHVALRSWLFKPGDAAESLERVNACMQAYSQDLQQTMQMIKNSHAFVLGNYLDNLSLLHDESTLEVQTTLAKQTQMLLADETTAQALRARVLSSKMLTCAHKFVQQATDVPL